MLTFNEPISDIIARRHSCRSYNGGQISAEHLEQLRIAIETVRKGPLGTSLRFELVARQPGDEEALKGLGTYGSIKSPAGFVVGIAAQGDRNLEDLGYGLESVILFATSLGLGSCWLGGFSRNGFFKKVQLGEGELIPAIAALGYGSQNAPAQQNPGTQKRQSWDKLFFHGDFSHALAGKEAGPYNRALEMVRIAPSAHNYQPWRVVKDGDAFHFFMQRTPGYGPKSLMFRLTGAADLQRIDMGIAMCHFDLAAREQGLAGSWRVTPPSIPLPDETTEYVTTWVAS